MSAHKNRNLRALKATPTSRAIRAALATSAALLALAGSGAAFAGTCVETDPLEVTCTGVFTDSVENSIAAEDEVQDLTLILGSDGSTTVDPSAGVTGLTSTWGGDATVITNAAISTSGADGIHMYSNETATLYNYGSIYTEATGGGQQALDVSAFGDVTVVNSGYVETYSGGGQATGVHASSFLGDVVVDNSGSIAVAGDGYAEGIHASTLLGDASVDNSGSLQVTSYDGDATGINAYGKYADIDNSGTLAVSAYEDATGITVQAFGSITVYNSGSITVTAGGDGGGAALLPYSEGADAVGISAISIYSEGGNDLAAAFVLYGPNDVNVINTADILVNAAGNGVGLYAATIGAGSVYMYNSGDVSVYAGGSALGLGAYSDSGTIEILNYGAVTAHADYGDAVGIGATDLAAYGDITIANAGTVSADAYYGQALGIAAFADGPYGFVDIDNSGSVSASSGSDAIGVLVYGNGAYLYNGGTIDAVAANDGSYNATAIGVEMVGFYGNVGVVNAGGISASSYGALSQALGVYVGAYGGNVYVDNYGDISADATGTVAAAAFGVVAESYLLSTLVDNLGTISATADGAEAGYAFGVVADAAEFAAIGNGLDASIDASASGYYAAVAEGASASGVFSVVYNYGSISATAEADYYYGVAYAYGVQSEGIFSAFFNGADASIEANASGYFAVAIGSNQYTVYGAFNNEGSITANAEGYVAAYSVGSIVNTIADVTVLNSGSIHAESSAYLSAYSTGAYAISYFGGVDVDNSGDISAESHAYYGVATGLAAYAYYDVNLVNSGSISGVFAGYYGYAYGAILSAGGDITVDNSGDIYAGGYYYATALLVDSDYTVTIHNTGTIEAYAYYSYGGDGSIAIHSVGLADVTIYNYGTITGAIITDGYDTLYNFDGGVWNAVGDSYFGVLDDAIWNYEGATINMADATIDMGLPGVGGNQFYNYGLITVEGDNAIYMGAGNPLAFYNYGTISFLDGAPDDYLLIVGDFAGDGDINVDVSGLDEVSDVLYIDGSVVDGSVGTINVDILDVPNDGSALIPIVYVSEDSSAGDFVLGDVNFDEASSFVTVDFELVADIDATNATPDVFALGIEVTGLSDPGTLAASLAPSMLSMVNTQVGTWRQRMGVIDGFRSHALSLWARVFRDKGSFTPGHVAGNFGPGGNFDWHQTNTGIEAGVDFAVTDEFSLGVLLAQAEADTHLEDGVGSAELEADSYGVYATWISNGWYVDASYRWADFEFDTTSVMGQAEGEGDAETFNIEAGYAWTTGSGLKVGSPGTELEFAL